MVCLGHYFTSADNGPADGITKIWTDRAAWVAEHYPDKPFIISETGAGGIVGLTGNKPFKSNDPSTWTEEYQRTVDKFDATVAMTDSNVTGLALWQFCDIKVDQSNSSTHRPGGINNKGVVDQWRKPKLAAAVVAAAYSKKLN